ncbi:MAG: N-acetyltransferase, partial [Clostridiales bacterium]|nr:N-acetyltransferase [Clostridiales bacterium]
MKDKGTKTIETERLILRRFTKEDICSVYRNWTSDELVTEYLRWPTHKDI